MSLFLKKGVIFDKRYLLLNMKVLLIMSGQIAFLQELSSHLLDFHGQ